MGEIKPPDKVKPIMGILYRDRSVLQQAVEKIESSFSPIDFRGDDFPFVETEYYNEEMGAGLIRTFLSLRQLIYPDELPHYKQLTNLWEEQLAVEGRRTINLDPGYIGTANLVLASTKNFAHRVYLAKGIYAEVTMQYMHGDFTKLPWTYPDYWNHKDVFLEIRKKYRQQLKEELAEHPVNFVI